MNKEELDKEVKRLTKALEKEKLNSATLIRSSRELKKHAEEAGSELAKVEQELIRYKDKYGETL